MWEVKGLRTIKHLKKISYLPCLRHWFWITLRADNENMCRLLMKNTDDWGREIAWCLIREFFLRFFIWVLMSFKIFKPSLHSWERRVAKGFIGKVFLKPFKWVITWFLKSSLILSFKNFDLCLTSVPLLGIVVPYIWDSLTINIFQISFNYLCPFKSFSGVPVLSEHSIYHWMSLWERNDICKQFENYLQTKYRNNYK